MNCQLQYIDCDAVNKQTKGAEVQENQANLCYQSLMVKYVVVAVTEAMTVAMWMKVEKIKLGVVQKRGDKKLNQLSTANSCRTLVA